MKNSDKIVARELDSPRWETRSLFQTLVFLALAIFIPAIFGHASGGQLITGTLVNALLFLAAWRLSLPSAALIAILPSSIALMRGLLPAPLATVIPFIILANLLLIALAKTFDRKKILSVLIAGFFKFLLLFLIISLPWFWNLSPAVRTMLVWPQLFTAFLGGVVALSADRFLFRK